MAAEAIWRISEDHQENKVGFAEEGAITPLVSMLASPQPEMCTHAAAALASLSKDNTENQAAIARTGAIAPLCSLVREAEAETKEQAAWALWALSLDNAPNKVTIAKLGGIEPLVGLVVTGGTEVSGRNASGALASLASKHAENRTSIAKRLTVLLNTKSEERAVRVLAALAFISADNAANQVAVAKAGAIPAIVSWLASETAETEAAHAVLSIAVDNLTTCALVIKSEGIPPLIKIIARSMVPKAQEYACRSLWHLAALEINQTAIAEAGGVPPLISMLSADVPTAEQTARARAMLAADESLTLARELAAVTLRRLVQGNLGVSATVAESGGIPVLVTLLSSDSAYAQQQAVASLTELALLSRHCDEIAAANGVQLLVKLLSCPTVGTPELSARALNHLARGNDSTGSASLFEDDAIATARAIAEAAKQVPDMERSEDGGELELGSTAGGTGTALAAADDEHRPGTNAHDGPERRASIRAAGGVTRLIRLLVPTQKLSTEGDGKAFADMSKDERGARATNLWLAAGSAVTESVSEAKKESPLEGMPRVGSGNLDMAEEAAAALAELANGDETMQDEIISQDGVPPLLELFMSENDAAQENAARCVWHLCASPGNHTEIVYHGTIKAYVALLKSSNPRTQAAAAAGLSELARGGVVKANRQQARRLAADEKNTASATPASTIDNEPAEDDRLHAIAEASAIPPLIAILSAGSPIGKQKAACALAHLATARDNQQLIFKANGIPPLVSLLDSDAGTLETQLQTAHHVADALACLARFDAENQGQIAKRLVVLLSSERTVAQVRGARALWSLAADQPSSPVVILNAGALLPLMKMLTNESSTLGAHQARKEASGALESLAMNSPSTQQAIATGLVSSMGTSEGEGGEYVIELLLKLCNDANNRAAIAQAGGLAKLVPLLDGRGGARARELAAATLAMLTNDKDHGAANIAECMACGGIKSLVAMLKSESVDAQAHAAAALAHMARGSSEGCQAIIGAGAIDPLTAMLSSGTDATAKVEASCAIWSISSSGMASIGKVAIGPLIELTADESNSPQVLAKALGALAGLTEGQSAHQKAAMRGIDAIVNLLKPQSEDESMDASGHGSSPTVVSKKLVSAHEADGPWAHVQAKASAAIAALATGHAINQSALEAAGAIQLLVQVLINGKDVPPAKSGAGGVLVDEETAKSQAAIAIWRLTEGHQLNQQKMAELGAIPPLVSLLGAPSVIAQQNAAGALAAIAKDNAANEQAIARQLVELLSDHHQQGLARAAFAIARLARSSSSSQDAIAKEGGVARLVSLLRMHVDAMNIEKLDAMKEMSDALWSMAQDNTATQRQIVNEHCVPALATMIESQHTSLHRNAAGALSAIAQHDDDNRQAVAHAGCVELLVPLLIEGDARPTAACALAKLALASELREPIATAGAVPLLVALFQDVEPEASAAIEAQSALAALTLECESNQRLVAEELVSMLIDKPKGIGAAVRARRLSGGTSNGPRLGAPSPAHAHRKPRESRLSKEELVASAAAGKEQVLRLIVALCTDRKAADTRSFDANRAALATAGAMAQLVLQLKNGTPSAQALSASAMSLIVQHSVDVQLAATQQLVGLLTADQIAVRRRASAALLGLGEYGTGTSTCALAGGVAPLLALLKDGARGCMAEAQEYALWSLALANDESSRAAIVGDGCTELLVASLGNEELLVAAREHAVAMLVALATDAALDAHGVPEEIERKGGIVPLVHMLEAQYSDTAKTHAALCLERLSTLSPNTQAERGLSLLSPDTRAEIAGAGAIGRLLDWLELDEQNTPLCVQALTTLDALATGHKANASKMVGEGATAVILKILRRARSLLERDEATLEAATHLLATIVEVHTPAAIAIAATDGAVSALTGLLAHENVARTICHLSTSAEMQASIARGGGIPPLVACLGSESTVSVCVKSNLVAAVERLSQISECRVALVKACAVGQLAMLLQSTGEEATRVHCINSLLHLATGDTNGPAIAVARRLVTVLDAAEGASATSHAVKALGILSARAVQVRMAILQAKAVPPLVRLLGDGKGVIQLPHTAGQLPAHAASVLADLSRAEESLEEVFVSGGIFPLVSMLTSESTSVHTSAATILLQLATRGEPRMDEALVVAAEAIPALVHTVSMGCDEAQRHAVCTLWQLSNYGDTLSRIIAAGGVPPLVAVLASRAVEEVQEAAAAILEGLAEMSEEPKGRSEIVAAGGVPLLVDALGGLLNGVTEQVQLHAASTLYALCDHELSHRAAVLDESGIDAFFGLLADDGTAEVVAPEVQGCAMMTLQALAETDDGKEALRAADGVARLGALVTDTAEEWLRRQVEEVVALLESAVGMDEVMSSQHDVKDDTPGFE